MLTSTLLQLKHLFIYSPPLFPEEDLRWMICIKETQLLGCLQGIYFVIIEIILCNTINAFCQRYPFLLIGTYNMDVKFSTCLKDMNRNCRGEIHCIEMSTFHLVCCIWMWKSSKFNQH